MQLHSTPGFSTLTGRRRRSCYLVILVEQEDPKKKKNGRGSKTSKRESSASAKLSKAHRIYIDYIHSRSTIRSNSNI